MCSSRELKGVSSHDTDFVDTNSKEIDEIKSVILECSTNQLKMSSNTTNSDLKTLKKLSTTIATQTSLTLLRFTLVHTSSYKQFVDSTASPARFNRVPGDEVKNPCENTKSFPCMFVQDQLTITAAREATTQTTSSLPLLTRSRIRPSQDALQACASFLSSTSELKNEVLTITTDYGGPSTDTRSILVDAINQNDVHETSHTMEFSLPLSNTEPTRNNLFMHRTDNRLRNIVGSLNNCLRCVHNINNEPDTHPYIRDAPPAYSTMYANRRTTMRNWRPLRFTNRSSFIAPTPPPSYAQAQGIYLGSYSMDDLLSPSRNRNSNRLWSSRPMTAICPRCTTIVVTTIEVRQSMSTHATALALFLCGCWPCCMIPYCINSCKNIDHHCPICRSYLGSYRPW